MKIRALEHCSLEELKPFIGRCNFIPFNEFNLNQDLIVNCVVEELSDVLSRDGSVSVAEEQNEIVGLISSERSKWDSTHFGINISKIVHLLASGDYRQSFNVKHKLISHLLAKSYSDLSLHLSARVYKEDLSSTHALESNSFRLMDVLVTYFFDLRQQKIDDAKTLWHVRQAKEEDLPLLSEIAWKCFGDSPVATDRFHADPTLPREKSGELYVKWLNDSYYDSSSVVLVAETDGNPTGFNICNLNEVIVDRLGLRLGTIALTAVKPSERGKLVATSLLKASLRWFIDKVDIVETGGQVSNYAIQRTWSKIGFKILKSQCTFHWSVLPDSI